MEHRSANPCEALAHSLRHPHQRRQMTVGVRQDDRFDDAGLPEEGVADLRSYRREHVVALGDPERIER